MTQSEAQILGSGSSQSRHLYTLKFKNGQIIKHQDSLAFYQFRSDGRLASVISEGSSCLTESPANQSRTNS
jgi:hypothetical protein